MAKNEHIVRYTAAELDEMLRRGEDLTDWAKVDAMTEEELEASIDFEEEGVPDYRTVWLGIPTPGQMVYLPMEPDVADWFRADGPGYPERINTVLRDYVDTERKKQAQQPESKGKSASRR